MLDRLTLRRCFMLGFLTLIFSAFTTLLATRYLGKSALFYKVERAHKVTMLEFKAIVVAAQRGDAAQHSRAQLLALLDTTRKIALDGLQEYFPIEKSVFTLAGFGKPFELTQRDIEINSHLRQLIEQEPGSDLTPALASKIEPILSEQFANSDRFAPEFDRIITMTKWSSLTLMLFGLALVFIGTELLRRRVLLPLQSATKLASKIAQGDLTTEVRIRTHDEVGILQTTLKSMNDNLANIAQQVRASGEGHRCRQQSTFPAHRASRLDVGANCGEHGGIVHHHIKQSRSNAAS